MNITPTVELKLERCYECGRYWAHETASPGPVGCPLCTLKRKSKLYDECLALQRRLVSQRGATTKARRKR